MRKAGLLLVMAVTSLALVIHSWADQPAGVEIGGKAPGFTLQDQNGKDVSLSDSSGKITVLEWTNPNCPFVQRVYRAKTMQTLAGDYQPKNVVWIAINSSADASNDADKQWAVEQNISYPILNDVQTDVGKAYHATNTPEMFIVGTDGTLLYKGAIDNDPDGSLTSGKVNYVQQALDEILAGKPVSVPETHPYGCGVHYRD
ncbi:MAG: redoxin domain-containing protein [Tepidisphaeraceae bacterium]|jgi:peroxiredoxin